MIRRLALISLSATTAVAASAMLLAAPSSAAPPVAERDTSQASVRAVPAAPGGHAQVVTVRVEDRWSTQGILEAWKWSGRKGGYVRMLGPVTAYVGSEGVGQASEWSSTTPAGVYTLTEAFGRLEDPGTQLRYRKVGRSTWWVSDVDSPKYNTMQRCDPGDWCGFDQGSSEQLGAISVYSYAIVIDYNRDPPVPGKGSAFFIHETDWSPTQGCISIERSKLVSLLRWLKPGSSPVVSIGVGSRAYAPLGR